MFIKCKTSIIKNILNIWKSIEEIKMNDKIINKLNIENNYKIKINWYFW
ncbi:hypothetical protein HNP81_002618 [Peribacillus huizhouensis]|uniref:Uncharacterized protein n=1 Tax=Peribacillus huizhouensis TaxID=1501239 RepID=A0ABR6CRQ1_9BACI|nr:hypothetical protein [Peribacillus huizhouensis]